MQTANTPFHERSLLHILARAARGLREPLRPALYHKRLNESEWLIVTALLDSPGATAGRLAAICGMQQPTTSKALDSLSRKGVVEFEKSETDRRVSHIGLTIRGRILARVLTEDWDRAQGLLIAEPPDSLRPMVGSFLREVEPVE